MLIDFIGLKIDIICKMKPKIAIDNIKNMNDAYYESTDAISGRSIE